METAHYNHMSVMVLREWQTALSLTLDAFIPGINLGSVYTSVFQYTLFCSPLIGRYFVN